MKVAGSRVAVAPFPRFWARAKAGETKNTKRAGKKAEASANSRSRSSKSLLLRASTSSNRSSTEGQTTEAADSPVEGTRDDAFNTANPSTNVRYADMTSPSVP